MTRGIPTQAQRLRTHDSSEDGSGSTTGSTGKPDPSNDDPPARLTTPTDSDGNPFPTSLAPGATATAGDPAFLGGLTSSSHLPSATDKVSAGNIGAAQKGSNTGPIVGGILGALAVILLLIAAFLVVRRRRRNQRVAPSAEFMQRYGNFATLQSPTPTRGYEDDPHTPPLYSPSQYPFAAMPEKSPGGP
ncbi:hypothetical protein NMY22_g18758 [Coprinellus aureogranulatus]|nr:hypothetical protein NMY22_g18758 [Coprinellus aureogranulatus]